MKTTVGGTSKKVINHLRNGMKTMFELLNDNTFNEKWEMYYFIMFKNLFGHLFHCTSWEKRIVVSIYLLPTYVFYTNTILIDKCLIT